MPIPIISEIASRGIGSFPYIIPILKVLACCGVLYLLRLFFNGTKNGNERILHSKVAIVTGGTSGIGATLVEDLAQRGMQLILLVKDSHDIFTIDYIEDLRTKTGNQLIYAETCDLSDLHSVRLFATKFIDNTPPRRLDAVICCAGVMAPPSTPRTSTKDGVEEHWGVNYLAHFHLLNLLAPVIRVQPPDRDVRILLATCTSHVLGELDLNDVQFLRRRYPSRAPWLCYGASKVALMAFGVEYQRRTNAYKRPDKEQNNVRIFSIDPGLTRTPGTRRWLSFGSLWGLAVYMVMWPLWWLVLKDTRSAMQTFLTAIMSPECGSGEGGKLLRECSYQPYRLEKIASPELGQQLWEVSELMIKEVEKESARKRAEEKKNSPAESTSSAKGKEPGDMKARKEKEEAMRKAAETIARRKILDQMIKEEEAKMNASMDLPEKVTMPSSSQPPDTPSRNTRSRTDAPPVSIATEAPERSETPSRTTRKRTKKA